VATTALVRHGEALGEAVTVPLRVLEAADGLLAAAAVEPPDLDALVVGVGPGSFTGVRIGLAVARGLALALDLEVAGVSTLDALAEGGTDVVPVIDAKRREVFIAGPRALAPAELEVEPGAVYVGDGALRYRDIFERAGGKVPADEDERHLPRARFHAALARDFGPVDELEPLYVRLPDAVEAPR